MVYAPVPKWMAEFGWHGKNADGSVNLIKITGNLPGLCVAGAVLGRHYDTYLRRYGFTRCAFDPRVYVMIIEGEGFIILLVFVDDTRSLLTAESAYRAFLVDWAREFEEKIDFDAVAPSAECATAASRLRASS